MKMREKMLVVLLLAAVVIVWVFLPLMRDLMQRAQDTLDWQDISEPARSPYWFATHCDYIEIDPMDESPDLPDGVYENCDESSIKSPRKDLSDRHNDKTLDPTRIIPGEPARHWEIIPARKLKGSVIY